MLAATEKLHSLLETNSKGNNSKGNKWRDDPQFYYHNRQAPAGSVNVSPGWFPLGHEVSNFIFIDMRQLVYDEQRVAKHPKVCPQLNLVAGSEWLDEISRSNMVLSAILAVIHPELYEAGKETNLRLGNDPDFQDHDVDHVLSRWGSAFNGVAVLSNRITPAHRDGKSRKQWYDMLVTLGAYQNCQLTLSGLGVSFDYGPGTVVGLSGMMLVHEVSKFEGDRVCYAYFMRDSVHEWAGVPVNNWMNTKYYK
jgi:hypothetical protein